MASATALATAMRETAFAYMKEHPDIKPADAVTACRILETSLRFVANDRIQTSHNQTPPTRRTSRRTVSR